MSREEVTISNLQKFFPWKDRKSFWNVGGELPDGRLVVQYLCDYGIDPVPRIATDIMNLSTGEKNIFHILQIDSTFDPIGLGTRLKNALTGAVFLAQRVAQSDSEEVEDGRMSYWILKPLFDAIQSDAVQDNDLG